MISMALMIVEPGIMGIITLLSGQHCRAADESGLLETLIERRNASLKHEGFGW